MAASVTQQLAEWIAGTRYADIPLLRMTSQQFRWETDR
jgi:hypothetical protein